MNKTDVEALPPGEYFNPVEGYKGLCVRVMASGKKAFVLRYRVHGIQKKLALGEFPSMTPDGARIAHTTAWGKINTGTDPLQAKADAKKAAQEQRIAAVTVADLADRYIREHIPGNSPSWGAGATRLINLHILPALGKVPVAAVGPAEVSAMLYSLRDTPTEARLTRAVLRTMFRRAEEWEYRSLGSNPVSVVKLQAATVKRERRLSDLELKTLGAALQKSTEAAPFILAIRMAILAGMRKGEVAACRWSWVDLEAGEIRIPADSHKTGRKTGKARVVHLCDALAAQLKAAANIKTFGCPYVVPGKPKRDADGVITWEPIVGLQGPWERIRDAAGLAPKDKKGAYLDVENNPGLHDLRRTFASVGADLGLKGFIGELLGHAEATVTDIYTRAAAEPLHEAAEKIGSRIESILTGQIDPEFEAEERRKAKEMRTAKKTGA